jgi:hypothetical protein
MVKMQTFLPFDNFEYCAEVLDWRRLGKQRVEAYQILNSIQTPNGWSNHYAVKMWVGCEELLKLYTNCMIREWVNRGYNNTMQLYQINWKKCYTPEWMGDERLHSSHRANLIRKDPKFYSQYNWKEEPQQGYWWPYIKFNKEWINAMRVKKFTEDCSTCDYLSSNTYNKMICTWGKSKDEKVLVEKLGKEPLKCRLIHNNANKS